ncbi:MAG: hypothetical protein PHC68_00400 [Syntrophorhabdaceae bacterium]|nr:hypothetical protein [Syntrophorhabdaceae bacterium]
MVALIGSLGIGKQASAVSTNRKRADRLLETTIESQSPYMINMKMAEDERGRANDLIEVGEDRLKFEIENAEKQILALDARSKAEIASNEGIAGDRDSLERYKIALEKELAESAEDSAGKKFNLSTIISAAGLGVNAVTALQKWGLLGGAKSTIGGTVPGAPTIPAYGAETAVGATTGAASIGGATAAELSAMTAADYGVGGAATTVAAEGAAEGLMGSIGAWAGPAALIYTGGKVLSGIYSHWKDVKESDAWLKSPEGQAHVKATGEAEQQWGRDVKALPEDQQGAAIGNLISSGRAGMNDIENRLDAATREGVQFDKGKYMRDAIDKLMPSQFQNIYDWSNPFYAEMQRFGYGQKETANG